MARDRCSSRAGPRRTPPTGPLPTSRPSAAQFTIFPTGFAGATICLFRVRGGASVQALRLAWDASGHLLVRDSTTATIATSSGALSTTAPNGISITITPGATSSSGSATVKLWIGTNVSNGTPTETFTLSGKNFGSTGGVNEVNWGAAVAPTVATNDFNLDDMAATDGTLPGAVVVSATVDGSATVSGTAAGRVAVNGSAGGSCAVSGTAAGRVVVNAAPAGAVAVSGAAAGSVVVHGAVTGAAAVAGAVAGRVVVHGSAAGGASVTGAAAGVVQRVASVAGSAAVSGSAAGVAQRVAVVAGSLDVSGAAAGVAVRVGTISGSVAVTGTLAAEVQHHARRRVGTATARRTGSPVSRRTGTATPRR
jgi:hypothetical protein